MADITLSSLMGGGGGGSLTLTGDVTGTGTGTVAATIPDNTITLAKMADMATASFLGRNTAATGDPEVLSIATVQSMLSLSGTNTGDQTTITGNAGTATTLQNARTIAISGPITGTATSFNGSANITIPVTAIDLTSATLSGVVGSDHLGTLTANTTKFLRGDSTWSNAIEHTTGVGLEVSRTNSANNSTVQLTTTGGSLYMGMGSTTRWGVGSAADINGGASNWFSATAAGLFVGAGAGNAVWHAGNLSDPATLSGTQTFTGSKTFSGGLGLSTAGINFGSQIGASSTDLSKHISLWSTVFGFSVTSNRLNYVAPSAASHKFIVNGADIATIANTGLSVTGTLETTGTAGIGGAVQFGGILSVVRPASTQVSITINQLSQASAQIGFLAGSNVLRIGNSYADGTLANALGIDIDSNGFLTGAGISAAAGNNTIVKRAAAGYIYANFFNTTANVTTAAPTNVMIEEGDGFIRKQSLSSLRINSAALSGPASAVTMDEGVAKYMRWKNFGAGHIIFDASQSTSPAGGAVNNTNPDAAWQSSYPTIMGWNGSSTYGVRVYIANVADATSGAGIIAGTRIFAGYDAAIANSMSCSAWFRSNGNTGWFNSTHAGGMYMTDANYVRVYNKPLAIDTGNANGAQLQLEGIAPTIAFYDTDGPYTTWLHCNQGNIGFLAHNAFAWSFYRDSANNMQATGNITAYASDRRLKTNIKDISMARVNKFFETVRIRTFDWDEDAIRAKKLTIEVLKDQDGAIAQEMREAYPDAVVVNEAHNPVKTKDNPNPEKHDILTIKWEKLVPLLVAKVKEQDERIAALEALNSSITGSTP